MQVPIVHRMMAAATVLVCLILLPLYVRADAVVDWNAIAVQTALSAGPLRPGPTSVLDIAMVHAAIYDAVEAIDKRFRPYHAVITGASGSKAAAAAKAAHDVLVNRFPAKAAFFDTSYHDYLSQNGLAENDPGVAVGQQAAASIISLRANDGSFPIAPPFTGGTQPGEWRPTFSYLPGPPPSFSPMAAPWLGTVRPFTLMSSTQFRAEPPPALNSHRYTRAYREVKALGELTSTVRTPEQTDLAYFYSDNFIALWHRGLRDIATTYITDIGDSARLFALASLAIADAVITAWDSKRHYAFWRPITAIQEGNEDGNRRTVRDPDWQPFLNTPPYPDYTSGANVLTGSVTQILTLFFGTDWKTFTLSSQAPQVMEKTRTYQRFSDAARDAVDVRVYQGIHFRFADTAARRQGRHVANWTFSHFLRPIHDDRDDDDDWDDDDD